MTPKERRIIERDLGVLFSTKAFLLLKTIEDWKAVGFFHPQVRTASNSLPLSEAGIAALRRITGIMQNVPELRRSCSVDEIAQQIHESYEGWIGRLQQPDADEFIESCIQPLLAQVVERTHLISLHGLELSDIDRLDLGAVSTCKPDLALLREVQFGGAITEEWIMKDFACGLWLIGRSYGSPETSLARFDHQTILVIGILAQIKIDRHSDPPDRARRASCIGRDPVFATKRDAARS